MAPLKEAMKVSEIRPVSSKNLRKLRSSLEAAREIDVDITVAQLLALVEIALDPGITISAISELQEVQLSTGSRHADVLGVWGRGGKKGHRLIDRRITPVDRRIKGLFLTPKGARVVAQLVGE